MAPSRAALALSCAVALAAPAAPGQRDIRAGQSASGALTAADELAADTTYSQRWRLTAAPGEAVTIDLSSEEFDPVLIVTGPDLDKRLFDDDGGPGCGARVTHVFPSAGPYTILVNTTSTPHRQTGRFVLSVTNGRLSPIVGDQCRPPAPGRRQADAGAPPAAPETAPAAGERRIAVGQTRQGALTADDILTRDEQTYAQEWSILGAPGLTVTVDLESTAFDSYLFVTGPGLNPPPQDDDSGGNCHARLTVTFPQRAEYRIVVNNRNPRTTGPFTLSVTPGAKPASLARCNPGP